MRRLGLRLIVPSTALSLCRNFCALIAVWQTQIGRPPVVIYRVIARPYIEWYKLPELSKLISAEGGDELLGTFAYREAASQ